MRVAIAGATGLVGQELTNLCLTDKSVEAVFALVRKPVQKKHLKLQQITIDYDNISENDLPNNIDVLFNCLGTTIKKAGSEAAFKKVDFNYVVELATISAIKKVPKFISVSSMGANKNSRVFYYRVKGQTEDFLINDSHLENVFIVRPSLLLGKRQEFRLGESVGKFFMQSLSAMFIGKLKKHRAIPAEKVARAMLNLSKMNESGKKILENDALQVLGGIK